jgi:hypothetical protein
MAFRTNPFLERVSERTTSDVEFVRLFSPKILERIGEDAFHGGVHVFRSPPGGGKTTLLRAFTPAALRAFWASRRSLDMGESYQRLVDTGILSETGGPQVLGVLLSCASGYADLPTGATGARVGLFRALLDCRVVLRTLRSLAQLLDAESFERMEDVQLEYEPDAADLKCIPRASSATQLMLWAEQHERAVYSELDSLSNREGTSTPEHLRFESVLWLQSIRFLAKGRVVAPRRILMIDDVHKLRRQQRSTLIEELTELRPRASIWLAERSIALGGELLSQGARQGRDLHEYSLEELWTTSKGHSLFASFAQNILDRRLAQQEMIPAGAFSQHLRDTLRGDDSRAEIAKGTEVLRKHIARYRENPRYGEWLSTAEESLAANSIDALRRLCVVRILLARDELKRQLSLEFSPLTSSDLEERDSSQVQAAAEIFLNETAQVPYYYGLERLCILATNNAEEVLALAAALFEGLLAKQVLRKPELVLAPGEQEKIFREAARRKRDFIPKNHTEGTRAQRLLDAIGSFCRERTFVPNAPIAPGVTGVRLSHSDLALLDSDTLARHGSLLHRVLSECVAENLLVARQSSASTSREGGTVLYLNRTLCVHYGLPLQYGGWQDVGIQELVNWMERGPRASQRALADWE